MELSMTRISIAILAAAAITAGAAAYADGDNGASVGADVSGAGLATHPCVSYDYHDDGARYCSRYQE